mgnify:CR=1 FL=1
MRLIRFYRMANIQCFLIFLLVDHLSKGMDFVLYIWNFMKWNSNRLLWQIRNKKTMELSGVIYTESFFKKGKIWIAVLGSREKPFGRLFLSLSQNEIVQNGIILNWNERYRTQGGLARPDWRLFGRKGILANLLHKVLEKRNRKTDPHTLNEKVA